MRWLLVLVLASGCFQSNLDAKLGPPADGTINGDGGAGTDPNAVFCQLDGDCALAGATCCECPTFAVASGDFGCNGVACPTPSACPAVQARCVANTCAVVCTPVTCDAACADGFVTDAAGCLTCACAPAAPAACHVDGECARVAADCCGCAAGGMDTAVLASDATGFVDGLGCPMNPQCPGIDTCEPGVVARCLQGSCALTTVGAMPATSCGRPDLPACPASQQCILNSDATATSFGVGVCGTLP
ncbi:MAG: hypothetical protein NT062_34480 [Proteobacteria bacterium]|nr:hypothetical protein [Pseudomonadota bacterium]